KNLTVRDGYLRAVQDRTVESLNQILHARRHMEVPAQERPDVPHQVPDMLLRKYHRWNEGLEVAWKLLSAQLDQSLLIRIEHQTVFRAIDTKLMDRGTHLRREREIGCGALLFTHDDSKFVDDLALAKALEERTHKSV